MLLSEMVRKIAHEQVILSDTTVYSSPTSAHDWSDRATKTFTLPVKSLVYVKFKVEMSGTGDGAGRLVIDGIPAVSSGGLGSGAWLEREAFVVLDSGEHTFKWQSALWYAGGGCVKISNRYVYAYEFADTKSASWDSGGVTVPDGSEYTVLSFTISGLKARRLACGRVKNYRLEFVAYMLNTTDRKNLVTQSLDGYVNWKLYVNGTGASWAEAADDRTSHLDNSSYGIGAYGKYRILAPAENDINVEIKAYNRAGSSRTCRAYVFMFASPWIIPPSSYEPLTLSFPQGSTLYVVLEPLFADPTKALKIGNRRAPSFGDATDYYYTSSGTGVLRCSYTFEMVEVANCVLLVEGCGGCISMLGVDVR